MNRLKLKCSHVTRYVSVKYWLYAKALEELEINECNKLIQNVNSQETAANIKTMVNIDSDRVLEVLLFKFPNFLVDAASFRKQLVFRRAKINANLYIFYLLNSGLNVIKIKSILQRK